MANNFIVFDPDDIFFLKDFLNSSFDIRGCAIIINNYQEGAEKCRRGEGGGGGGGGGG